MVARTEEEIEKILDKPLSASEIDFRIQSINKGGYATILAYKDARVDMNRLDKAFGKFGWKRAHTRDNRNCVVSIRDPATGEWVSKEDTGVASMSEADKGLASDSFKRACVNIGPGRGLYDFPEIKVQLRAEEFKIVPDQRKGEKVVATYKLALRKWRWYLEYNEDGEVTVLAARDAGGKLRHKYDARIEEEKKEKESKK